MSVSQRWQHVVLFTSFIILVITGFALKFPESWFAHVFGMGEHLRGIIHRIAGVALMSAGIYHVFYVISSREGRRLLRDLAPAPGDGFDALKSHALLPGPECGEARIRPLQLRGKGRVLGPGVGHGTDGPYRRHAVGQDLGGQPAGDAGGVDVATAIHYYEAILATLAIVVWHFYQVFFDPDVYPMNGAWWDGKMPLDHYREEHGLDAETLGGSETGSD